MSALAKILKYQGHWVAGSDLVATASTEELKRLDIPVFIGHQARHITDLAIDRLVINGAIADNNPELLQAQKSGIKVIYRETLLAEIARKYKKVVAIAGCHGKSSTTALVGQIFTFAGQNPTIHNGVQNNLRIGSTDWLVTEACEFRKSFLKLKPTVAVVTNVDADHLDCYRDLDEIKACFAQFAAQSEILIKNATDPNSAHLQGKRQTVTFGIDYGDVHAQNLQALPNGAYAFELVLNPQVFGCYYQLPKLQLQVPGKHHVANALAAVAVALVCRLKLSAVAPALTQYQGIARRFQTYGKLGNTPVILDYAHHPREIQTTLATASSLYAKYLLVFQPHTYTRTLALWDDFVAVLQKVPHLVIYKTYAARGKVINGGRALDLSRKLKVPYIATVARLRNYLLQQAPNYAAIILCGAGDVVGGTFLDAVLNN